MQVSRLLLSPLAHVLRHKQFLPAAFVVAMLCGVSAMGYAQGTSMVILHAPVSSFGSGGNAGLIQVAEMTSGKIVTSPNAIQLTISGGTAAGPFTTGTTTSGITPTYSNGIATFDLSTLPLYAYPSNTVYTLAFTDTGSGSPSVSPTVTATPVTSLFIVNNFTDTASTPSCTNWYSNTTTPTSDTDVCTLRQALTYVSPATATAVQTSGSVSSVTVSSGGGSYNPASPPTVTFAAPTSGTTATGTATVSASGAVTGINITNAGTGYTTNPAVTIANPPITAATIAFNGTWPQTISLTATLGSTSTNWVAPLTIAGPGVNNLIINGGNSSVTSSNGFQMLHEHSGTGQGIFNLTGMTLENGYIASDGAALYLYGTANIWNVYFYKNVGTSSGGAVYAPSTASSAWVETFNYCVFDSNNDNGSNAGAIGDGATNGNLVVNNSLFYGNTSTLAGGAINFSGTVASTSTVVATISNSTFINNVATTNGGAIGAGFNSSDAASPTINLINDTFYGNTAAGTSGGGAMYVSGSTTKQTNVNMTDVTMVGNLASYASAKGGTYYGSSGSTSPVVNNSLIEGNSSGGTYSDIYFGTAPTFNSSLASYNATAQNPTYPYATDLATLVLSDPGSYGGPQLSIFTGGGAGSYYASVFYGAASALASPPILVPLPGSPALKIGAGSNQGGINSDERSPSTVCSTNCARPTTASGNIDVGAVQTSPTLVFTAEAKPANMSVGTVISPAPTVAYEDDNTILSNSKAAITMALAMTGGGLSGTTSYSTKSTTLQSFSGVAPTTAGSAEYLTATAGGSSTGNVSASSGTFNVTSLTLTTSMTSVASGSPVTVTATLTPYTGSNGEVLTFYDDGNAFGTGTLANGVATLMTTTLPVGNDSLTAIYAGDASYAVTTSPAYVEVVTGTESVPAPIAAGTPVTVTLTFTSNFTLGNLTATGGSSPNVVSMGALSNPFTVTGGTCTVGTTYGPSTANPSCTVQVTYTASGSTGGGLITGTVQVFDTSQDLQGYSNVVVARNR